MAALREAIEPVETMAGSSLEERVNDCYRALALIHAACQGIDQDVVFLDHEDLIHAISQLALNAAQTLEPLRHAPGMIAN